ncbi:MAG: EamA family transporter [Paracoccaceae bacterium]
MSRAQANLLLMAAAALWGFGNVAQKTVLEHLDPFSAVGLRCLIGGLVILRVMRLDRDGVLASGYWPSAIRVAAIFALTLVVQQLTYLSAPASNIGPPRQRG